MSKVMVTRPCIRCGKSFEQTEWRSKHPTAVKKTCSPKCCYQRWGTAIERFHAKVEKHRSGCWNWTGNTNNWGYAMFWEHGKKVTAHKWAYLNLVGPIPVGKVLMHSCDNPKCVNPKHLSVGTLSENSRDCLNKSRKPKLKLNVELVRHIRTRLGPKPAKWKQYEAMAEEMGMSASAIYLAHVRRTWKWVTRMAKSETD